MTEPAEMNRHHRKPRSRGGNSKARNISLVTREKHEAWHLLFRNASPYQIAEIINAIWLDADYVFICEAREKANHESYF
jgi:hypothetical protein